MATHGPPTELPRPLHPPGPGQPRHHIPPDAGGAHTSTDGDLTLRCHRLDVRRSAPRLGAGARCCRLRQCRRKGFWSVAKGLRCCVAGRFPALRNNDDLRTPGPAHRPTVRRDPPSPLDSQQSPSAPLAWRGESRSCRIVRRPRIGPQRRWRPREEPRAPNSVRKLDSGPQRY